jgi:hypothetical protein
MLFALRAQADRMSAIRLVRSMVMIEDRKKNAGLTQVPIVTHVPIADPVPVALMQDGQEFRLQALMFRYLVFLKL